MDRWTADLEQVVREELATWPAGAAGITVVLPNGPQVCVGEEGPFPWASVTKLLTALAVLDAELDEVLSLEDPLGPPGATVRHLLAHASGIGRDSDRVMAPPAQRRIYSNRGIELLAQHLQQRTGRTFESEIRERVLGPLGMRASGVPGSAAYSGEGPVADLARLAHELLVPRHFPESLVTAATTTAYPGLDGLLPGFGTQKDNDWGLGFEVRGRKAPHWMAPNGSPASFGHFGQSGAFLWVDPVARVACVGAGSTPFGPWATEAWPRLAGRVLAVASSAAASAASSAARPASAAPDLLTPRDRGRP